MIKVPVKHGGLMRCCIATLDEDMANRDTMPAEGEVLHCKYCKPDNGGMIFKSGAWEWNAPPEVLAWRKTPPV